MTPKCPNCKIALLYADSEDHDTETMGGLGVEYLRCPKCGRLFSLTEGDDFVCWES